MGHIRKPKEIKFSPSIPFFLQSHSTVEYLDEEGYSVVGVLRYYACSTIQSQNRK